MTILIKIFLFGAGLYGVLLAINAMCLPAGWRSNWREIFCATIAAAAFLGLCIVLP